MIRPAVGVGKWIGEGSSNPHFREGGPRLAGVLELGDAGWVRHLNEALRDVLARALGAARRYAALERGN
jgi:hypothetical protein